MSRITTHVLDTASGKPAAGMEILLEFRADDGKWQHSGGGRTDADGRIKNLMHDGSLKVGKYRLTFRAGPWLASQGRSGFYDDIPVEFVISNHEQHFHVPLLLSPFGYSTYRGS